MDKPSRTDASAEHRPSDGPSHPSRRKIAAAAAALTASILPHAGKIRAAAQGAGAAALSASGAATAAREALLEYKQGRPARAALSAAEACAQTFVALALTLSSSGIAKATPWAKRAGPVGAALAFAGSAKSLAKALGHKTAGRDIHAAAHIKGAGIRALGGVGSLGAGIAAGAALGSAAPIAGTILGAVAGGAAAFAADRWAQRHESGPSIDPTDAPEETPPRLAGGQKI